MKVSTNTIVRTILAAIALLNTVLIMLGKTPLDLDENTIYIVASGIATIATTIWAWWKNNSFTHNALCADAYKKELKKVETV